MKLAIIGSRAILNIDISAYIPENVELILSGGAKGVDALAEQYANTHGIPMQIFRPRYDLYGKAAPLKRNQQIIEYADEVLAFWDGRSRGTKYSVEFCRAIGKPICVIMQTEKDMK